MNDRISLMQDQVSELEALSWDPTLESCCRRDAEQQCAIAKAKVSLLRHDRVEKRLQIMENVLKVPENIGEKPCHHHPLDDVDKELEELRCMRLKQLKKDAMRAAELGKEGCGCVKTVKESELLELAFESYTPHVVCHCVAVDGASSEARYEEFFDVLARKYTGTRFFRCPIKPSSTLPLRIGLPEGIVYLLNGEIKSMLPFQGSKSDDEEETIDSKLRRLGALFTIEELNDAENAKAYWGGMSRRDCRSDSGSDVEDGEWMVPCTLCGRRYPHQHVRTMYQGNQSDDGE